MTDEEKQYLREIRDETLRERQRIQEDRANKRSDDDIRRKQIVEKERRKRALFDSLVTKFALSPLPTPPPPPPPRLSRFGP
jgi:hypothetical protein